MLVEHSDSDGSVAKSKETEKNSVEPIVIERGEAKNTKDECRCEREFLVVLGLIRDIPNKISEEEKA